MNRAVVGQIDGVNAYDLYRLVERLAAYDERRFVRLIELLSRAADPLRELMQQRLRELIAAAPASDEACVGAIDAIIERLERQAGSRRAGAHDHAAAVPPARRETQS